MVFHGNTEAKICDSLITYFHDRNIRIRAKINWVGNYKIKVGH